MELRARYIVEGLYASFHRSPFHTFGIEFAGHRKYERGDEPRHIDWPLFSRTDKYYVKQFHNETNMRCVLLLDCSRSMGYRTAALSKLDYACYLSAALAFLILEQSDAVGLMTFDSARRDYIGPRGSRAHLAKILRCLENSRPGTDTDIVAICHDAARAMKRRGLIILLSDLLEDPAAILQGLRHLRCRHHDVIVFHVLDPAEREFPFKRLTLFRDAETSQRVLVDARSAREWYLARLGAFIDQLRQGCHGAEIDYVGLNTAEPFDRALRAYLARRARS
jgi:uncharacterized protein (DUF58 family)